MEFKFGRVTELLSFEIINYTYMQKILISIFLVFFVGLFLNLNAQEVSNYEREGTSSFQLTITGISKVEGEIRIAMFDSREKYTKDPIHAVVLPVDSTTVIWTVDTLAFGEYAIAIYHDKNTNGKLDTNLLGIPKEDYGFSNDARGRFGPASWKAARFEVKEKEYHTSVRIH